MDTFVRKNFLALWCVAAVIFAVAKGLTIFQQKSKPKENPTVIAFDTTHYWQNTETTHYQLFSTQDSLHTADVSLTFQKMYFNTNTQVPSDSSDDEATPVLFLARKINTDTTHALAQLYAATNTSLFVHALKAIYSQQQNNNLSFSELRTDGIKYQLTQQSTTNTSQMKTLRKTWLEDELWTLIRLDTNALPKEEVEMIPALDFCQKTRIDIKTYKAQVKILENKELQNPENQLIHYTVSYPDLKRSLTISYQKSFPHQIVAWQENTTTQTWKVIKK